MSDTTPDASRSAERLAIVVARFYRRIRMATGGLSHGLLSALASVSTHGPLRPADLAEIEGVSAPSATRVVADLESRGLVEREADPDDGRAVRIAATEEGRAALLRARGARTEAVKALLESLDDDDQKALLAALPALERLLGD